MIEMDDTLRELAVPFRSHIEIPSTGTVLRVLSAEAGLQLGLSPSFVVFDELAVQPNDRLYNAMALGSGGPFAADDRGDFHSRLAARLDRVPAL